MKFYLLTIMVDLNNLYPVVNNLNYSKINTYHAMVTSFNMCNKKIVGWNHTYAFPFYFNLLPSRVKIDQENK